MNPPTPADGKGERIREAITSSKARTKEDSKPAEQASKGKEDKERSSLKRAGRQTEE